MAIDGRARTCQSRGVPDTLDYTERADDDLNRAALLALMACRGIDGFAQLAKRARGDDDRPLDRTVVSRIVRGERPALQSHILAFARALKVSTLAITGTGIDIEAAEIIAAAEVAS